MATNKNPTPDEVRRQSRNEDPISGESGAHPVGSGAGAALGGAAAGAAAGALAGPVGTVAGAIVGGIAGAAAGKAIAENVNPTVELEYWRRTYNTRPYYNSRYSFEDYEPAYRYGWESYTPDVRDWASAEAQLRNRWQEGRWESEGGSPKMSWDEARAAAKDAYERAAERARENCASDDPTCNKPR